MAPKLPPSAAEARASKSWDDWLFYWRIRIAYWQLGSVYRDWDVIAATTGKDRHDA